MARLSLSLLGSFQAMLDGTPVTEFRSDKTRALLAYLALEADRPHRRDALAGLLWPDVPDQAARNSLRQSLHRLRQAIGETGSLPAYLDITSETVQFNAGSDTWLDVAAFDALLTASDAHGHRRLEACRTCIEKLRKAAELYRGDFLHGFFLEDGVAFSEWAVVRREWLHRRALQALFHLAEYHRRRGEYEPASTYARRQLELEPWREEAHRQLMWVLALGGERSAALAQYETCRRVLAEELGVEPSAETTEVYERIRSADAGRLDLLTEDIVQVDLTPPPCPYRGLFAFREQDAHFFFGREASVARLVKAVQLTALVTVLGSSGSGKSSVIFAGLLPHLRTSMAAPQSGESAWAIADFRPGSRPFHALASALLPIFGAQIGETDQLIEIHKLAEALQQRSLSLSEVADSILQKDVRTNRLLLVIDQFEELYTLCPEPEVRRRFLDMLLEVVEPKGQPVVTVVLAMRADFMGQALAYRRFADALQDTSLILGPMTREELKQAIENPAGKQGITLESGLVERILTDVGDEPGHLPLLEFTLTCIWDRQEDRKLTHAAYDAVGQVEGALTCYAEGVYAGLSRSESELARRAFVQLVRPGEGTEDTRRSAARAELGEEGWVLAQHLADARLVVTNRDPSGQETVEVAHEALIRNWQRLREWMEANRNFRTWQERLRAGLRQWEETRRDEGAVLRGTPLIEAEGWLNQRGPDLSEAEQLFIRASLRLHERELTEREAQQQRELEAARKLADSEMHRAKEHARAARQLKRRALLLAGALIVASLLAVAALTFGRQATRNAETAHAASTVAAEQRDEALRQARLALSRQLSAQAISNLDGRFDLALLLSLEAYRLDASFETRSSLVASLQHEPRLKTFLHGHQRGVPSIAFSPDGRILAAGGFDGSIILWDVSDPESPAQLSMPLTGHTSAVLSVAFSPDGTLLASGGGDNTIRLWDVSNPASPVQLGPPLIRHTGQVNTVAYSPDGKMLASGSGDKTVRLWDVSNPKSPVQIDPPLAGHADLVWSVAFSPDGKTLASGGRDNAIILWDVSNPKSLAQIGPPLIRHTSSVRSVTFSPDGKTLASGSEDNTIRLWDVSNLELPVQMGLPLTGQTAYVLSVAFSQDGKVLASGNGDKTVVLWDVTDLESPVQLGRPLIGHADWVPSVAFSPVDGGKTLASAGLDDAVILWDISNPRLPVRLGQPLVDYKDAVLRVAFSPDGKRFASGGRDNGIILWDVSNPQSPVRIGQPLTGHKDYVWGFAFSPDGKTLASASKDKTIILWDVQTHQPIGSPLTGHTDQVNSVAFSPDGKTLASASDDEAIRLWDLSNPRSPVQLGLPLTGHTAWVGDVAFSPDGKTLASGGGDASIILWDVSHPGSSVQLGPPLVGHVGAVRSLAFSLDGKRLASAGEDNAILLWDVSNPRSPDHPNASLVDQGGFQYSVAFNPDGKILASGSLEGAVVLWDISGPGSPVQFARLTGHTSGVTSVAFSPDGHWLASGGGDAMIILWDIDFKAWQALGCRIANRNLTLEEWRRYFGDEPYRKTCPSLP